MRELFRKSENFSPPLEIHVMPSKLIQQSLRLDLRSEFEGLILKVQTIIAEKSPN